MEIAFKRARFTFFIGTYYSYDYEYFLEIYSRKLWVFLVLKPGRFGRSGGGLKAHLGPTDFHLNLFSSWLSAR